MNGTLPLVGLAGSAFAGVRSDDVLLHVTRGSSRWLLLAEASRGPFEEANPELSREILDACEGAIRNDVEILGVADARVRSDGPESVGWLSVVHVIDDTAFIEIVGGHVAWLVRGGTVISATEPHVTQTPQGSRIRTRGFGETYANSQPERASWKLAPGDAIVIVDEGVQGHVTREEIISTLAASRAAQDLAELAASRGARRALVVWPIQAP